MAEKEPRWVVNPLFTFLALAEEDDERAGRSPAMPLCQALVLEEPEGEKRGLRASAFLLPTVYASRHEVF